MVRGVLPEDENKVADLGRLMRSGSLADLRPGEFGVVLGGDLARSLGLLKGDKVAVIAPQGLVSPAGVIPRLKQFTVVGVLEAVIVYADSELALIHQGEPQTAYQTGS